MPDFYETREMTDADKVTNPQHFGRDRINPTIHIGILDYFRRRFALSEHGLVINAVVRLLIETHCYI